MTSKYQKIVNELEIRIRQMNAEKRRRLPTEKELCEAFECSRQTVRTALDLLEKKGLIEKRKGSGSYIRDLNENNDIIFITSDEDSYIYPKLISEAGNALKAKRFRLITRSTDGLFKKEREFLLKAIEDHPKAVIIDPIRDIIPNPNLTLIEKLFNEDIPVIYLFGSYPLPKDAVIIKEDNIEGGRILMRHLLSKGYRGFGFIFRSDEKRGLERFEGCMSEAGDAGITIAEDDMLLLSGRNSDLQIDVFIRERIHQGMAVVCQNDILAHQVMTALKKNGLYFPSDVALASFDNSYIAAADPEGILSIGHESSPGKTLASCVISVVEKKKITKTTIRWCLDN